MNFWSKLNILQGNLQNTIFFLGRQQLRAEEVGKIYPAKRLTLDQLDPNPTHVQTGQFVHLGEKLGCISAQADTIITRVSALSHT